MRLYDLVPAHVAAARTRLPHVSAAVADARRLPEAEADIDAVLLLGPMYLPLDRRDREHALATRT